MVFGCKWREDSCYGLLSSSKLILAAEFGKTDAGPFQHSALHFDSSPRTSFFGIASFFYWSILIQGSGWPVFLLQS